MKKVVAIFVTVLGGCLAQEYAFCTVPQWEGYEGTIGAIYQNGTPIIVESMVWLSYDLNHTRMAMFTSGTTGGDPFKVNYIYDYSKGVLYTIKGDNCQKTALSGPFQKQCIPQDAILMWGKTWLGGGGAPNEEIFILGFTGRQDHIDYRVSFLNYPLLPVMQTLFGEINGDQFFQTSNFMNVTQGIKDPSVYIPPSSCNQVTLQLETTSTNPRFGILPTY